MVLGEHTTTSSDYTSKDNTKFRQIGQETSQMQGHRKEYHYKNQIPKSTFCHSEEGHSRGPIYSRPIHLKQVHQVPNIPNVDHEPDPGDTSKTFLDSIPGSKGWLLAHLHKQKEKALFRVPLQGSSLALQGYALWPKRGTPNILKTNCSYSKGDGIIRDMVPPLFGRFANNQFYGRGMSSTCQTGNFHFAKIRLDPKHKEVTDGTSTNIRVARGTFRPSTPQSTSKIREDRPAQRKGHFTGNFKILLKTNNYESPRLSQFYWPVRPSDTCSNVKDKGATTSIQKTPYRLKNSPVKRNETKSCQMGFLTHDYTTIRNSKSKLLHPNRCLIKRLGVSHQSKVLQRKLRSHSNILYQYPGTNNNSVCTATNKGETCSDSNIVRQLVGCGGSQTLHIDSIPPTNDIRDHLEKSNIPRLESINISYPRSLQRPGGSTIQKHHHIDGMVSTSRGFSTSDTQREQKDSSGSFCNELKSPSKTICIPLSGSSGNCSRRNDSQLGEVETPLSVSTDHFDFEGFNQATTDELYKSSSNNTRDTNTTMVHGLTDTEDTIESNTGTATTTSFEQIDESNNNFHTSRVEVLKMAYRKRFPDCDAAVNLMATPLRKNLIRDYQHKWTSFLGFLRINGITFNQVTVSSVLRFFTYLFHQKHFKPGTVAHYKTALTVPLKEYFNIDLKETAFSELLRGMWLQRPNIPHPAPAWSLNKVLNFIEALTEPIEETMLLRKTAFLLLLSTGWRISELHACVRNKEFCRFSENSSLFIRPHPSFLAKNELPYRRWSFKEIKILKLADGSTSKLCPVTALRRYLSLSSDRTTGDLLLTPGNHQKKLTIHQLTTQVCSLILQADHTTKSNVHDIRAYAASFAFAEGMLVGDLVSAINWSSPAVFYKFYFTQTEPMERPLSLPVQRK